ncbi:MAG: sortase [Caldilineales bacterium]|nr:sortase [Caldilineales bacterium]
MSRRYTLLFAGLFIALALVGVVWARLAWGGRDHTTPTDVAAAPTWTPTAAVVGVLQPTAASAATTPAPTATAAPIPTLTPTPFPPEPTNTPTLAGAEGASAPPVAATSPARRIDSAGPIPLPTIQPLPIGQGLAPVRLLIPALGLDAPVLPMGWHVVEDANGIRSEWDVVDDAAGHHIDSVFPGEAGNVVLSGHNNIGGAVFRSVCVIGEPGVDFGLGDEMILQDEAGRSFVYQVEGWQRFAEAGASIAQRQANARYLAPTARAQLTLITCWPPTSNTHRVVVTGPLTGMR